MLWTYLPKNLRHVLETLLKIIDMNRTAKIALIVAGVVALGVGGYFIYQRMQRKSGNKTKDDRNIQFVKS